MGIPVNAEIDGRYVLTVEIVGINSKLILTRISDSTQKILVMNEEWLNFMDGMMCGIIDHQVVGQLCDAIFA